MIDSSSFRSSSSPSKASNVLAALLRNLDGMSNISLVQINPITTKKIIEVTELQASQEPTTTSERIWITTSRNYDDSDTERFNLETTTHKMLNKKLHRSRLNKLSNDHMYTATVPPMHNDINREHTITATSTESFIKILIETTDTSTESSQPYRMGKFREHMNKMYRGRVAGFLTTKQHPKRDYQNTPIIKIRTLSPMRAFKRTIPTRPPARERVFKDRVVDIKPIKYHNKLNFKKFKSKCRCEKISNCPKFQMTIARCPSDYFMCCF